MNQIEQKIWKVVTHPSVRIILVLSWPLAALCGSIVVVKNELLFRIAPIISIFIILGCFLGLLAIALRFRSKSIFGAPFMSYLTLMEIGSIVGFAYFSASCITLKVLYHWILWDLIRPHHLLPDPRLYPTANLAYLGLMMSLILWAASWRRKETSRPL